RSRRHPGHEDHHRRHQSARSWLPVAGHGPEVWSINHARSGISGRAGVTFLKVAEVRAAIGSNPRHHWEAFCLDRKGGLPVVARRWKLLALVALPLLLNGAFGVAAHSALAASGYRDR